MARYKLIDGGVIDTDNSMFVPNDPSNRHWQEYLEWDATNTADPADLPTWDSEGRGIREEKLRATDWTQLNDFPGDGDKVTEFNTYRQALRDLPETYPDYATVVWPTEPTYP